MLNAGNALACEEMSIELLKAVPQRGVPETFIARQLGPLGRRQHQARRDIG